MAASAAGLLGLSAVPATAAPITLTTTQTSVVLDAGDSVVITGQITNVSGGPLLTTDFSPRSAAIRSRSWT
ncbi:hypothetical protein ACQ86G_16805 [Roseateles chitinivorans]|uniref:hypothetical protein n=1 Tax=Roseateles chitinivorans TaxID=2917965 RepID=UPI003D665374